MSGPDRRPAGAGAGAGAGTPPGRAGWRAAAGRRGSGVRLRVCVCECVSARERGGGVAESGNTLCKCWRNFSKSDLAKTQANQEEARRVLSV